MQHKAKGRSQVERKTKQASSGRRGSSSNNAKHSIGSGQYGQHDRDHEGRFARSNRGGNTRYQNDYDEEGSQESYRYGRNRDTGRDFGYENDGYHSQAGRGYNESRHMNDDRTYGSAYGSGRQMFDEEEGRDSYYQGGRKRGSSHEGEYRYGVQRRGNGYGGQYRDEEGRFVGDDRSYRSARGRRSAYADEAYEGRNRSYSHADDDEDDLEYRDMRTPSYNRAWNSPDRE